MNIITGVKLLGKFITKNSSTILKITCGIGIVGGTAAAVVQTVKAVGDVQDIVEQQAVKEGIPAEEVKLRWKQLWPVVLKRYGTVVGLEVMSILALIFSSKIDEKRRKQLLMVIESLEVAAADRFQAELEEFGDEAVQKINARISKKIADRTPIQEPAKHIQVAPNQFIFEDSISHARFYSDTETVRRSLNSFGQDLITKENAGPFTGCGEASHDDLLYFLGYDKDNGLTPDVDAYNWKDYWWSVNESGIPEYEIHREPAFNPFTDEPDEIRVIYFNNRPLTMDEKSHRSSKRRYS